VRRKFLYLSVLLVLMLGLLLVPGAGPAGSQEVAASGLKIHTYYATDSDGHLMNWNYDYTTAHDAASAYYAEDTGGTILIGQFYAYTSYFIIRSALYFDTSSLPDDATVIGATLKLYGTADYSDQDFYILVMSGADLDDPLQPEDYGDLLNAPYGGGLLDSRQWTVGGWNSISLSYGLGGISKTGPTKFGLKSLNDLCAFPPSQTEGEHVLFSASEGGHPAELQVIYTEAVPPTVTTNSASSVTATGATLNGYLNDDGGEACQYRFEWGLTSSYGNATPWTGSKTSGQSFSQSISGLSPCTTYHFRAQCKNSVGVGSGGDRTFTTPCVPPTVTTYSASSVTDTSATLNGYLNDDGGQACQYRFQWGLTSSYGNTTPWTGSKTSGQSFSRTISGLKPGTTYHFRAQCQNSAGVGSGGDLEFRTDNGDISMVEVGVEWIEHYDDQDDLPNSQESAEGFYDKLLAAGWNGRFNLGDDWAWERHFKRDDPGWDGWDYYYVDAVDAVWFQGHGSGGQINFNYGEGDDRELRSLNAEPLDEWGPLGWQDEGRWGDVDLEWMFLHSCETLQGGAHTEKDRNTNFAWALNGIHLICGAKTKMLNKRDGEYVARYLLEDGHYDPARQVKGSWFLGCDINQPSGRILRVIGEDAACGADYIWGQGPVCDDPTVDDYLSWWDYTTT